MRGQGIGLDVGKALGGFDGLATYSRMLISALAEVDGSHHYHLYDLHSPRPDQALFRARFPGAPSHLSFHPSAGPAPGEVALFHSLAHRLPPVKPPRLVFTLHDLTFLSHPGFHTVKNRVETLCAVVEAACTADRFIAVSEHTKGQAMALLGLAGERIVVIPEAADPCFKPVDREERRSAVLRRLGVDGPFLLTVGSLEPRKNLGRLLDALALLPEDTRSSHTLVVTGGPGWCNRELHERIERGASGLRVRLTGEVPQDDLAVLYSCAEAFVYPSLAEGFGLPVLEAMACGAPVVTSSTTSLPEVVGEAAILVDPADAEALADAVGRVLADSALRRELRARGFHRVAEFSWQRSARKTLELYRALLGE